MANASKTKGDRGEREAVAVLSALVPDLVVDNPQRKLGAGRKEDTGDLVVLPDVTIQVKTYGKVEAILREAAVGAETQRERAGTGYALGMAPIPRARQGSVRWVAATLSWPGEAPDDVDLVHHGLVSRGVAQLRREDLGVRRDRRIVAIDRAGLPRLYLSPIEAWLAAWRLAREGRLQLSLFEVGDSQLGDSGTTLALSVPSLAPAEDRAPQVTPAPSSPARLRPAS